jgi:hypothetical protein
MGVSEFKDYHLYCDKCFVGADSGAWEWLPKEKQNIENYSLRLEPQIHGRRYMRRWGKKYGWHFTGTEDICPKCLAEQE